MIKHIYLLRGSEDEPYIDFKERVLVLAATIARDHDTRAVSLTVTEIPPPSLSVIPFKKRKVAAISLYKSDSALLDSLVRADGFAGVYPVTEALPVFYEKKWPDNEKTPGICLLTLFRKKTGLDQASFIDIWHNSHTPLSLKVHPLWHYNRNVIEESLTADAEPWDGIVEEHFRSRSELLNPFKFFGSPFTMLYHMAEVYLDTRSFLDYRTIEPYLVSEYHIKS